MIPVDIVKTRIQNDATQAVRQYDGMIDCAAKIYREEGLRGFGKGSLPLLLRAFPVSAITFMMYEQTIQLIH